jgi:hypothetical protein
VKAYLGMVALLLAAPVLVVRGVIRALRRRP